MKLFKKAMASVLAGVLALSMVACGTTAVPPTATIPTNPTASAEENVLAAVNLMRNEKYGHFVDAVQVKEGTAARDALADTIAALLSADPNSDHEAAVWTRDGKVYVPVKTIVSVMQRKGFAEDLYTTDNWDNIFVVTNTDEIVLVKTADVDATNVDPASKVKCLEFERVAVQQSNFGSYAKQQLANVGYKMGSEPSDIGIAQVKTMGNAIILVGKPGVNLAIAPNSNLQNALGGNQSTIG